MIIQRDFYLNRLKSARHDGLIKIITGLRRSGKSFLLFRLFADWLRSEGVAEERIIKVDLEDRRNIALRDPDALLAHIDARLQPGGMNYVLLDEVQHVEAFEDVLNSYLKVDNADLYVTGSNSHFLSSDIITEFRGRGEQIHVYPLSFAEFLSAVDKPKEEAWRDYYTFGGLPHVATLATDKQKADYLHSLCESVYLRDIVERYNLRGEEGIRDLLQVVASSIGAPTNPTKLSNTFKSRGNITISNKTIQLYLEHFCDAFLTEKAMRYDVKGKKYINTLSKYYFSDVGIRNAALGFRQQEETHLMENIIYNELRIRGFGVDVGVVEQRTTDREGNAVRRQLEVDFVCEAWNKRYYIQSAYAMPDEEKIRQEQASLLQINDSFKKVIIVKDYIKAKHDSNGLLTISLFDFLLNPGSLDW
jgi:hypothetical protein